MPQWIFQKTSTDQQGVCLLLFLPVCFQAVNDIQLNPTYIVFKWPKNCTAICTLVKNMHSVRLFGLKLRFCEDIPLIISNTMEDGGVDTTEWSFVRDFVCISFVWLTPLWEQSQTKLMQTKPRTRLKWLKYGSEEKGSSLYKCSILLGFILSKNPRGLWLYLLIKVQNATSLVFLT